MFFYTCIITMITLTSYFSHLPRTQPSLKGYRYQWIEIEINHANQVVFARNHFVRFITTSNMWSIFLVSNLSSYHCSWQEEESNRESQACSEANVWLAGATWITFQSTNHRKWLSRWGRVWELQIVWREYPLKYVLWM